MAAKKKKKTGPYPGYFPQKYLYDYLSIKIDPYDFPHYMLEEWAEERDVKIGEDDHADSLTPAQLKDYEQWLIDNEKGIELVERDPAGAPAYLIIESPQMMPKGTWAIHFTDEPDITEFQWGATIPRLSYSTWWKEKEAAKCPENLSDELGSYDYVYIFAFPALGSGSVSLYTGSRKYGPHAVLFQTDAAVKAWHIGDEEYQLIIPACSEYNVIPLRGVSEGISCAFDDSEGDEGMSFDSLKDLISYVETGERKGERPLERLRCS